MLNCPFVIWATLTLSCCLRSIYPWLFFTVCHRRMPWYQWMSLCHVFFFSLLFFLWLDECSLAIKTHVSSISWTWHILSVLERQLHCIFPTSISFLITNSLEPMTLPSNSLSQRVSYFYSLHSSNLTICGSLWG